MMPAQPTRSSVAMRALLLALVHFSAPDSCNGDDLQLTFVFPESNMRVLPNSLWVTMDVINSTTGTPVTQEQLDERLHNEEHRYLCMSFSWTDPSLPRLQIESEVSCVTAAANANANSQCPFSLPILNVHSLSSFFIN